MKIAIDARILRSSTGRYVERLLHYLQEIDHDNNYIVLLDAKDYDTWTPTNPNFTKHAISIPNYSLQEQINFPVLLNKLGVDLVHFVMPQQPLLYFGTSVTTIHDLTLLHFKNYEDNSKLSYDIKQFIFKQILRVAAKRSKVIITPTEYVKQDLIKTIGAKADKITVTLEAADPASGEAEPVTKLIDKQFIMYVGRMDPYKNIRRLILAHQQLIKAHPDLQLVLAGKKDGNVQSTEAWAKEQGMRNVHFLGFISDEQLRWLMEHTRAYVFASLSEGFGLPPLEAMTYGAPVVSSNATCLPEVNQDGAHYFNPEDVEDIAAKINDVLVDETLRTNLIAEGKKVVRTYSWKRMAEQTLEVYQQALQNK